MKNCKIPVRDPAAGEILLSSAVYRRKDRGISLLILILACRGRYVKKIMKISIKYKRAILPDTFKRLAVRAFASCETVMHTAFAGHQHAQK